MEGPTTIKEIMDKRPSILLGAFLIRILRIVAIILNLVLLLGSIILFVNSEIIATDFVSAQLKIESSTEIVNLSEQYLRYTAYISVFLALLMGLIAWLCRKLLERHTFAVELEEYIIRKKEERALNDNPPTTNK